MSLPLFAWSIALTAALVAPVAAASRPAVEAEHGMAVASEARAAAIGADILRRGGNAIDAAVAIGYAEAVTNPCCGNLGGGGFLVAHLAMTGRDVFIDFRETAPAAATKTMYLDAAGEPIKGRASTAGAPSRRPARSLGLDTALTTYGTMDRATVMAPAIALARDGFVLMRADADIFDAFALRFHSDPEAAKIFLRPDGSMLQPGDRLVQTDLAATLQAIADHGPDAFYRGPIAAKVDAAMRANGGILTAADFAAYKIGEDAPLACDYRGYRFVSAPPPSSGGATLCEILNVLEGYDLAGLGFHSAASVHLMVEAMRHAYMDRNTYLGDPAFVKNPLDRLLSKDYAARIRAAILPDKATPSQEVQPGDRAARKDRDDPLFGGRP